VGGKKGMVRSKFKVFLGPTSVGPFFFLKENIMIKLTQKAIDQLAGVMQKEKIDDRYVRVGVKSGGCAGLNYQIDISDKKEESDRSFDFIASDGTKFEVVTDPKSYLFINGLEIDYKSDLMNSQFTFDNPNASRNCGCGTSFDI